MRLLPVAVLLLAIPFSYATFNDLVDRFNQVKDLLSKKANKSATLAKDEGRFVESFNLTDISKVRSGLRKLRQKALDKINASKNEQAQKILQRLQKNVTNKERHRIREEGDNIRQVNERHNHTDSLYQLDIVLTTQQMDRMLSDSNEAKRSRRQAYKGPDYPRTLWPNNMVYYFFDVSLGTRARQAILKAIEFWQNNTCISFKENPNAQFKLRFFPGDGCYSYVGFVSQGPYQDVSIGQGCESMGTAAHEIGHALGFFHTQSRWDRDDYITVDTNNIAPDFVDQFDKETQRTNDNFGMPYDWGSIMQYGATSASYNGRATMVARNTNYQDTMGSDIIAFYDVSMMNELYQCKAKCPASSSVTCLNAGYPHPRNCQVCICPRGYGGANCGDKSGSCGTVLTATSTPQTFEFSVGNGDRTVNLEFQECTHFIVANPTENQRIEATITALTAPACNDGCVYGGVEIKGHEDVKMSGYRYCCRADVGATVTSSSWGLPIIGFNRYIKTTYTITYRAVPGASKDGPQLSALGNVQSNEAKTQTPSYPLETSSTIPSTTTTQPAPKTHGPPMHCWDDRNCRGWIYYFNFCNTYPVLFQKMYCPRLCGYC